MLYIIIVNETSPEANWNMQTDRQADRQDHLLSQADALTKNDKSLTYRLLLHQKNW